MLLFLLIILVNNIIKMHQSSYATQRHNAVRLGLIHFSECYNAFFA